MSKSASPSQPSGSKQLTIVLLSSFFIILVLMLFSAFITLNNFQGVSSQFNTVVTSNNQKVKQAYAMRDAIRLRKTSIIQMSEMEDFFDRDEELQNFYQYAGDYREARKILMKLIDSEDEIKLHEKMTEQTKIAQPTNKHVAELLLEEDVDNEVIQRVMSDALNYQDKLIQLLNELIELQNTKSESALASIKQLNISAQKSTYIITGIITFIVFIISIFIIQYVSRNNKFLKKAVDDAEQAAVAKSNFLASMSHEIRTPMNGVLGMLNLLLSSPLNKEQHHRATLAKSSAKSLLDIINDILDFSKIDAGKMELEMHDFDLRQVMGEISESLALQAQEKGLELVLDLTAVNCSMVKADTGRIRQIVSNLTGNAIKFTQQGEVIVRITLHSVSNTQWSLHGYVTDTGIGIADEKQPLLFESFTQADASVTRQYGGTGLGLSICKHLCELMHGEIHVSSELNKGSCFSFKVLIEKSELAQTVIPRVNMSTLNILIVDDNAVSRRCIKKQLEYWGASITEAESGNTAIELCKTKTQFSSNDIYDIAFIDLQMPEMNGIELAKAIRGRAVFNDMKLVLMTPMNSRSGDQYISEFGFNTYFPKPATTEDLINALDVVSEDFQQKTNTKPPSSSRKSDSPSAKWPENTRVLLVEDNQVNQIVANGILSNLGLQVEVAENGVECLEHLKSKPDDYYSLVLMDCQMPEMDGFEATKQIRAATAGEAVMQIPIIALTANAMMGDKEKCLQAGMDDYLPKPLSPEKLQSKLEHWLLKDNKERENTPVQPDKSSNTNDTEDTIWDKEDVLKRLLNKTDLLKTLLNIYFDENPKRLADIEQAIKDQDITAVQHIAHTIKGVAANLSGIQLQEQAALMEAAARESNIDKIKEILPLLLDHSEQLRLRFEQYLYTEA